MSELRLPRKHGEIILDVTDSWVLDSYYLHTVKFTHSQVYVQAMDKKTRKRKTLHIILMGPPAGMWVDHKNHNGLDNRRENLRICTPQENQRNVRKRTTPTSSKYKGVSLARGGRSWRARIFVGREIYLGHYKLEDDAAKAYNEAAKKYFKEFAVLNIIEGD